MKNKEIAGYAILRNKKIILAMDIGENPNNNLSKFLSIWSSFL